MPDAKQAIKTLVRQNNRVCLVTASAFTDTLGLKINNILKEFSPFEINEKDIIIAQDKSMIIGDVMVDDNYQNLITSRCPYKILYTQPWNASIKELCSVNDWGMITALITNLDKK